MGVKNYRAYICCGIFLLLSALKLLLPEHSVQIRERVLLLLNRGEDYAQMIETMGRTFSQAGFGQELIAALKLDSQAGEKDVDLESKTQNSPQPVETPKPSPGLADSPASTEPQETQLPEAVSAFLDSQARFEGYELPENVRSDMPELPFEYINPVLGEDSSGFGYRLHPVKGELLFHYGTDFQAEEGEAVLAFADGYVYAAGSGDNYGNYLILTHEGGFASIYANLSSFEVSEGDMVSCGQKIALVGQTGNATGPHLHFELLLDDVYINPEYYL